MEKRFQIPLLLDCYGNLLTGNQKEILELYYEADLSLGEIAENKNKSRQAVHDLIKRSERILFDYESKLKYLETMNRARALKEELHNIQLQIKSKALDAVTMEECVENMLKFLNEIY